MTAIVVVSTLTLLASFLCSILEAALYTVTPTQLEVLRERKVFGANRFARFRTHIEAPIAAILTVNTIAHTVGATVLGTMVGAWAAAEGSTSAGTVVGVFATAFTLAVLFLTEIVPKSLGVRYAVPLLPFMVWPMQILLWVSWPVARPCHWLMSRMTGKSGGGPTGEEIIAMSKMAARRGALSPTESRWVENALQLDRVSAHDLMTPRTVVEAVFAGRTVAELASDPTALRHSRVLVLANDDPDSLLGILYRRDVHDAFAAGHRDQPVRELVREVEFVPEGIKGPELLEKFIRGKRHLVVVIDEFGGFEGIVTLEDVLEALLGSEIVDEHDEHVDMQEFARRQADRQRSRPPSGARTGAVG